jgi:transposase-like protein
MKYGTQTRTKYLVPFRKGLNLGQVISVKAQQRLKWMDYIDKGNSVLKASRHFDIPEASIRYWRKRYQSYNLNSLEDQSRKPNNIRRSRVTIEEAQTVIELRLQYKGWGKEKLQILLKKKGVQIGQTRIQKIITQAGLKRIPKAKRKYYQRKNRKHMYAVPKGILKIPGGLVYIDVKHLYLPGGQKVYQFTGIDHATRIMRIMLSTGISSLSGRNFLEYLQKEYPFERIRYLGSDNGSENMGLMDKELEKRGIIHVFSSPRTPKQNPFVERVIRTVIDEVYYYEGLEVSMKEQQEKLNDYVTVYNEIRPHHSLNMRTPKEEYDRINLLHRNSQDVCN